MDAHRIPCVHERDRHRHVFEIGTGAARLKVSRIWSVAEVRAAITRGERFYIVSPSTGEETDTETTVCREPGCLVETMRPEPGGAFDAAFELLPSCTALPR